MQSFKQWLQVQEITTANSAGALSANPSATNAATQKVASSWTANPKNATQTGQLVSLGMNHKSALMNPLMTAAANAMKSGPSSFSSQTNAPQVAGAIQTSLNLPQTQVFKPPKLSMMRKR